MPAKSTSSHFLLNESTLTIHYTIIVHFAARFRHYNRFSYQFTMAEQSLIIYISPEPLSNNQPQNIDHNQQAITQGNKHTYYYHAIPLAFKEIEPYLALSSFPIIITTHLPL